MARRSAACSATTRRLKGRSSRPKCRCCSESQDHEHHETLRTVTRGWLLALLLLGWPGIPRAGAAQGTRRLRAGKRGGQNPVGDLISLPFQFNFNTGGLRRSHVLQSQLQPVMPIKVMPGDQFDRSHDRADRQHSRTRRAALQRRRRHPAVVLHPLVAAVTVQSRTTMGLREGKRVPVASTPWRWRSMDRGSSAAWRASSR